MKILTNLGRKNSPPSINQFFGSMPRFSSSLRKIRLIQDARAESPSLRISSSSCWRNSSVRRIWKGGERFSFGVDMVMTKPYINLHGNYHYKHQSYKKQCPNCAGTQIGHLTNPLYEETKMAKQKCTWLFAAINRSQRNARPVMLRITADNERSARRRLAPDYVLSFAGRIPCGGEHA